MSDTNTAAASTTNPTDTSETAGADTATVDLGAEVAKWKEMARKHEERAKANANAAKELEQLRHQAMTDQEKAVAQARAEGLAEGITRGVARTVRAEIKAAAAGRLTPEQVEALLEVTNLAVFVGEDGEVDEAKVLRFVDGIAPMPDDAEQATRQGFPDLGQGTRSGSSMPLNGDPLMRDLKAKLGVR
jgi:hypothetical protein